jgi:uncharacterized protein
VDRYLGFVRRRAGAIVLLTLLCTAGFLAALPRLQVHNPSEKYELPADDDAARDLRRLQALFGGQDAIIVALEFGSVMGAAEMRALHRLTQALERLEGVGRVTSLANAQWVYWQAMPPLVGTLYSPERADPAAVERLISFATRQPLYAENLVSEDGRRAALLVEFGTRGMRSAERTRFERRLVGAVRAAVEVERPSFHAYHLTGLPLIDLAFEENLNEDLGLFGVLSAVLAVGILLVLFRSWRPVALALSVAVASLVWALGVVSLTGTPLSVGLAMMVPLILVVSIAYSVHYLAFLFRPEHRSAPRAEVVEQMVRAVLPPSLLTGVTTAAGFLALNASGLEGVREVGTYLAVGVLGCVHMNGVFLPALLVRFPGLAGGGAQVGRLSGGIAHVLGGWVVGRTRWILAASLLLGVVSALGLTRLRVDSNHLFYFRADEPIRRDYRFVDEHFGGAVPVEILVTRPRAELDRALGEVGRLAADLRALPGIGSVTSVADLAAGSPSETAAAAGPGAPLGPARLPAAAWERIAGSEFGGRYLLLDDTVATLRVGARAHVQGTEGLGRVLGEVRERVGTHLDGGSVVVTGMAPVFVRTLDYIVSSQIRSFALAFVVILGLICLLTRSLRLGLLAMIANTLPILLLLGGMGWLRIPLDISTVMIASVVIGIAVDDTIHFLYRFLRTRPEAPSVDEALTRTFAHVGTPLVISTLVFFGGFLVLVPSNFVPISYFGLLSALTVLAALVGDLLLLPALLRVGANAS